MMVGVKHDVEENCMIGDTHFKAHPTRYSKANLAQYSYGLLSLRQALGAPP